MAVDRTLDGCGRGRGRAPPSTASGRHERGLKRLPLPTSVEPRRGALPTVFCRTITGAGDVSGAGGHPAVDAIPRPIIGARISDGAGADAGRTASPSGSPRRCPVRWSGTRVTRFSAQSARLDSVCRSLLSFLPDYRPPLGAFRRRWRSCYWPVGSLSPPTGAIQTTARTGLSITPGDSSHRKSPRMTRISSRGSPRPASGTGIRCYARKRSVG